MRNTPRLSLPVHWIMLAPALVILVGFMIYPAINAVYLSFTSTNLLNLSAQTFIGLDNFAKMVADPVFYTALVNSLWWTFGAVFFQLVFGMIGALALNQRIKLRGLIRGLVLLPWATPSVLIALMWMWILDPNLGIANRLLEAIGIGVQPWLSDTTTALPTLIFIDVWFGIPFFVVMILAALQSVPNELVEAARIDGANAWNTFWRVVLPLILPAVMITTTLRLIWTANFFDLILILTNGGPANASLTIPLDAYQTAYRGMNFGLGAALAVAQAAVLAILVVLYMRQIRKSDIA
jgi:multiple sugar transport system permease protein